VKIRFRNEVRVSFTYTFKIEWINDVNILTYVRKSDAAKYVIPRGKLLYLSVYVVLKMQLKLNAHYKVHAVCTIIIFL
jgi:hypothetical protein